MNGDYIKIYRSILDWEWWMDMNTTRVFIYMLLKANWKDGKFKGVDIPRGSFVASIASISEGTGLTHDEVRTAIKHLISSNNIAKQSTNKYTVFTVLGYDLHQDTSQANPKQIPIHSQAIPNDRRKEEGKKENNNITGACVRFEEFWNSYPKQTHRMLAEQAYCMLVSSGITEDALITASGNYAEYCNIKHTQQEFISHPDNWLNKSKWTDYTVENYKKPVPVKDGGKNKFNNFSQRNYDFDALEKQALRGQDSG